MRYRLLFIIYFIIFSNLVNAEKQLNNSKVITLKESIKIALQNNSNIFVSIEEKKKAKAEYKFSMAKDDIIVNGEIKTIERLRSDANPVGSFNIPGQHTNIGLFAGISSVYSLYDTETDRIQEIAKIGIDISKIKAQKSVNEIIFIVKRSYYLYQMATANLNLRKQLLKRNEAKRNLAKILFNSGQRPIMDVTKAEVGYTEAQLAFEKSKNNERLMKSQLYSSMGIIDKGLNIRLEHFEKMPELKYSIEDLYKLGEIYYPEIRIIKINIKINKIKIAAEKAKRYPKVDLNFALGYENGILGLPDNPSEIYNLKNWKPMFSFAFRAKFPVYLGGAIGAKIDSAIRDYNILVYQEKEALLKMKNSIRNYHNNLNEILKQIKMSKLIIENANKHLMLARKSYENGLGTFLDLQDAQVSIINAELGFHKAKFDYLLTLAKLSKTVGLGEESLCKK